MACGLRMAHGTPQCLSLLCLLVAAHLSFSQEEGGAVPDAREACARWMAGVPGTPGPDGVPGRGGEDGWQGERGDTGSPGMKSYTVACISLADVQL